MQMDNDEMQAEYDFSNQQGKRGKYYQAYRQGHQVRIHKDDGTTEVHYFTLEEGAVMNDGFRRDKVHTKVKHRGAPLPILPRLCEKIIDYIGIPIYILHHYFL